MLMKHRIGRSSKAYLFQLEAFGSASAVREQAVLSVADHHHASYSVIVGRPRLLYSKKLRGLEALF